MPGSVHHPATAKGPVSLRPPAPGSSPGSSCPSSQSSLTQPSQALLCLEPAASPGFCSPPLPLLWVSERCCLFQEATWNPPAEAPSFFPPAARLCLPRPHVGRRRLCRGHCSEGDHRRTVGRLLSRTVDRSLGRLFITEQDQISTQVKSEHLRTCSNTCNLSVVVHLSCILPDYRHVMEMELKTKTLGFQQGGWGSGEWALP